MREALEARTASEAQRAAAKSAALAQVTAALTDPALIPDARLAVEQALTLNADDAELNAALESLDQRQSAVNRGAAERRETQKRASLAEMFAEGEKQFDKGNYAKAVSVWESLLAADPT